MLHESCIGNIFLSLQFVNKHTQFENESSPPLLTWSNFSRRKVMPLRCRSVCVVGGNFIQKILNGSMFRVCASTLNQIIYVVLNVKLKRLRFRLQISVMVHDYGHFYEKLPCIRGYFNMSIIQRNSMKINHSLILNTDSFL